MHLIAKAKTKTDAIDARVLAKLYAAGFLPRSDPGRGDVGPPAAGHATDPTVREVRLKSIVQSILHANLIPRCPHADLFGGKGRAWLRAQDLPGDEQEAVEQHIQEYHRLTEVLKGIERDIARAALADPNVTRLMTIPGIDMVVAVGLMAAIGRIERFSNPGKLAAYIGLNPSVYQSGDGAAHHGRITKRGRSNARHLLVEAAWQTVRSPGPLRAFYRRVRAKRGNHIAAVAVARGLTDAPCTSATGGLCPRSQARLLSVVCAARPAQDGVRVVRQADGGIGTLLRFEADPQFRQRLGVANPLLDQRQQPARPFEAAVRAPHGLGAATLGRLVHTGLPPGDGALRLFQGNRACGHLKAVHRSSTNTASISLAASCQPRRRCSSRAWPRWRAAISRCRRCRSLQPEL